MDELFLPDRPATYNTHVNAGKIEKAEECIAYIQQAKGKPHSYQLTVSSPPPTPLPSAGETP